MATRGSLGGLARATRDAVRVLDAAGFNVILVETVGAGQSEVDIVRMAQTTLVVDAPGMGDEVQAIKAGILEIADVLIVNKADHAGAANTVRALRTMLELGHPVQRTELHHGKLLETANGAAAPVTMWLPPILQTVASQGTGVDEVLDAIDAHRRYLEDSHTLAYLEQQQIEIELHNRLRDALVARLLASLPADALHDAISRIQARALDPQTAVRQLLEQNTDHR
jgi:LAO/AO transport system kinase